MGQSHRERSITPLLQTKQTKTMKSSQNQTLNRQSPNLPPKMIMIQPMTPKYWYPQHPTRPCSYPTRFQLAMFKGHTSQSRSHLHLISTVSPDSESHESPETPEDYRELMRQRMWLGYLPEVISGRAESPELGVEDSGLLSPPISPQVLVWWRREE